MGMDCTVVVCIFFYIRKSTRLIDYTDHYGPGAQRFDMGERSNFALLPAFESAVRTVLDWGVSNIHETLSARNAALADQLASLGLHCLPQAERGAHYLCPLLPENAPDDLTARLKEASIFISRRGDRLRITPHLFTTDSDIERFIAELAHHLAA